MPGLRKVLFLSKGPDSSSTRYRAMQFFTLLTKAGFVPCHQTISGHFGNYITALRSAQQVDCVIVLRKTFPYPFLWLLRKLSRRLLFDFDDAIFCNTDGSSSSTRMTRFAAIAAISDHVFAGNEFLAAQAKRFNPAVTVIPTVIDPAHYTAMTEKPVDSIDLVWIGSDSTRKYLVDALPWLAIAAEKIPGLRLKIIADFDLPGHGITTLPIRWTKDTESSELASAHIGIAPMREDDWSRGKCALKVLQYMASGLPVVSSKVGANEEVLGDETCGYLVSSPQEWVERLVELAGDAKLQRKMGDAGRARSTTKYSLATAFSIMANVLKEAC
jgi:glycosyltransferase involved in cell wall biosynthesis